MNLFSNPYAKSEALECNPLNRLLYAIAFPIARVFVRLGVSPNRITVMSFFCAVVAAFSLAKVPTIWPFGIAWGRALVLDFCDGTVARMTNQVSLSAFRFDHTSDLVKVCAVLIAAASRYNSSLLWGVIGAAIAVFMLYNALNFELKVARGRVASTGTSLDMRRGKRKGLALRTFYSTFGTLNGHTLLFFFLLAGGETWALLVSVHLAIICTVGAIRRVRLLAALPRA